MKRIVKKILLITGILFGVLIIIAAIYFGPFIYEITKDPFNDKKFDRNTWVLAAKDNQMKNPRGPMAEDLRSRYLQIGMTKKDVRKLLGESDNSENDEKSQSVDNYFLGHWGYMSIDGDYLIIHYSKDGRLKSSEIYTH